MDTDRYTVERNQPYCTQRWFNSNIHRRNVVVDKNFTGVAATFNKDDSGNITRKYVGDHTDGIEHGIGVYESRFNNWGVPGSAEYIAMHRFAGQFVEGKCTGLGMKSFFDGGELFCGEYIDDLRNGIGYWKLRTGAVFIGEFKSHTPSGIGTMFSCNKYKFIGNVSDWQAVDGFWYDSQNNQIDIVSLGYYQCGCKYEGDRLPGVDGKEGQHGYGRLDTNTGKFYVGNWYNGVKEGYGEQKDFDWSIYEGEWKDNMRNGEGVTTFPNGSSWSAIYKDDFPVLGDGIFTHLDGRKTKL